MCLGKLKPLRKQRYGYKIFHVSSSGALYSEFQGRGSKPMNEWLDEKDYRSECAVHLDHIFISSGKAYPLGWHVFTNKKDAEKWSKKLVIYTVKKVEIRGVQATGTQEMLGKDVNIIVAKEIKILP